MTWMHHEPGWDKGGKKLHRAADLLFFISGFGTMHRLSRCTESLYSMLIFQNMLIAGLSAAFTSGFFKPLLTYSDVICQERLKALCYRSPFFPSLCLFLSLFLPILFPSPYFTLPLSSPSQQLNSCDWPSFEQGNIQGQRLSKVHWSRLCGAGLGFAENYTAIKQSPYCYADIYGTGDEGGIMAVEVLYEGIGRLQQGLWLRALPWNELWVQESQQRAGYSRKESMTEAFSLCCREITDICCLL